MTRGEKIAWIVIATVVFALVTLATAGVVSGRKVRLACEAAGFDRYESLFFSRTDYCKRVIVEQKMIVVPMTDWVVEFERMEGERD